MTRVALERGLFALATLLLLVALGVAVGGFHARFAGRSVDCGSAWVAGTTETKEVSPNAHEGCRREGVRRLHVAEVTAAGALTVGMTGLGAWATRPRRRSESV